MDSVSNELVPYTWSQATPQNLVTDKSAIFGRRWTGPERMGQTVTEKPPLKSRTSGWARIMTHKRLFRLFLDEILQFTCTFKPRKKLTHKTL